ncbi:acyltransferase family protein [Bdellovibrio sp. HCB-110]|uniref:acyltransferase family protein n=1 Tax=Bdellovibrio sp. HCB-110 TaxID=3391182 RepID=UPI0039B65E9C
MPVLNNLSFQNKQRHRTELDGLRGVAVLAVLFFHAYPSVFSGGYAGVDIFFVLSGYLVASSFFSSRKNLASAIIDFYVRRFKRLAPAAIFVCLVTWIIGTLVLLPEEIANLSNSVQSILTLTSHTWANSVNYFDISTAYRPLIHFWSLSIEILFYLAFPLLGIPLLRAPKTRYGIKFVTVLLAILLSTTFLITVRHPHEYYFSFFSRIWEFYLGICLFFYAPWSFNDRLQNLWTHFGLILIGLSIFTFNSLSNFPGPAALAPTLGAALIILSKTSANSYNILKNSCLIFLGKISFSLYLIHQPVMAYARTIMGRELNDKEALLGILLSIILSYFSWRFIESIFIRRETYKVWAYTTIFAAAGFLYFSSLNQLRNENSKSLNADAKRALEFRYDNNPQASKCRTSNILDPSRACRYHPEYKKTAVLWGDSHSDQIVVPFAEGLGSYGYSTLQFSIEGCPPIQHVITTKVHRKCEQNADLVTQYLVSKKEIQIIFIHAFWVGYFDDKIVEPKTSASLLDLWKQTLHSLIRANKTVIILGPVPKMPVNPPLFLARLKKIFPNKEERISLSAEGWLNQSPETRKIFDNVCKSTKVICIDIIGLLLDSKTSTYVANTSDLIFYRDDNHLSLTGSQRIMPQLISEIAKRVELNKN